MAKVAAAAATAIAGRSQREADQRLGGGASGRAARRTDHASGGSSSREWTSACSFRRLTGELRVPPEPGFQAGP